MVTHFRQLLIGLDPGDIGALWQEMFRKGSGLDGGRIEMAALSAVDVALHDLVAKSLGVPVYRLLGGRHRDDVPCFTPTVNPDAPNAAEIVGTLLDEGWGALRLSMGSEADGVFEPRRSVSAPYVLTHDALLMFARPTNALSPVATVPFSLLS